MKEARVLIACIGNIFLGDDGFGVEVARRFADRSLPPGVVLKDFGIRGLDLTYALLEPYDLVILVDAIQSGGAPGTLYVIEPEAAEAADSAVLDAHSLNPRKVLRAVKEMGGTLGQILIVGCEPADLGPEEGKLGLSEPVAAALDEALLLIESLVSKVRSGTLEKVLRVH